MRTQTTKTLIAVAVLFTGTAFSIVLTSYLERNRPPLPAGYEDEDMSFQGKRFKGFVFGAEGLLSDWYWMKSLQYIGGKVSAVGLENIDLENLRPLNPRLLYPYLNSATDLDPKFIAPYSYGATILPAIDADQAILLTEKGIENNPDEWRLYQYLGYIYWRLGNYERSSEVYERGSRIGGAPVFMRMMAARMKTEGGSREIAREMYTQIRDQAEDERSKENAELRLWQIDWLDDRDLIDPVLSNFRESNKRCPSSWGEVLPMLERRLPKGRDLKIDRSNNVVDPSGVPYIIEGPTCKVQLGPETKVPRV